MRAMCGPRGPWSARHRKQLGSPPEIKRILIIRPDHLGDLLFATPALERIRLAFPGAHITGLVGPWARAMWEGNPSLNSLDTIPFSGITASHHKRGLAPYTMLVSAAKRLARKRYDLGIALRYDHWWGAALLWASTIPYRWGYDTPGMGTWLTHTAPYTPRRHEVEQDLYLAESIIQALTPPARQQKLGPLHIDRATGIPPLRPPAASPPPETLLSDWLQSPRRAIIHPGTAGANKLWTITGWAEVAGHLTHEGWSVALTGSPDERPLTDAIQSAFEPNPHHDTSLYNVAGQTANIAQLIWLLDKAHIVLGVDSGPLHIADALNKPTLHLYGPSDEQVWGPWGDPNQHRAFRAPNTRPTGQLLVGASSLEGGPEMQAITPDMVMHEARALMRET